MLAGGKVLQVKGRFRNMAFNSLFHASLPAVVDHTEQMCTPQRHILLRSVASVFTCHACRKSATVVRLSVNTFYTIQIPPLPIESTEIILVDCYSSWTLPNNPEFLHMAPQNMSMWKIFPNYK
jgi:hypothetical protein